MSLVLPLHITEAEEDVYSTGYDDYMDHLRKTKFSDYRDIIQKRSSAFRSLDHVTVEKLQIDHQASYSITNDDLSRNIMRVILNQLPRRTGSGARPLLITDATACVGGDTITFASMMCKHTAGVCVNAVEMDKTRCHYLWHNLRVTGLLRHVNVFNMDYLQARNVLTQDIVFLDPPWGGPSYNNNDLTLLQLGNEDISDVCLSLRQKAVLVAVKAPWNFAYDEFKERVGRAWNVSVHKIGRPTKRKPCSFLLVILR
eukprot:2217122-Rhodomonas_salina.1